MGLEPLSWKHKKALECGSTLEMTRILFSSSNNQHQKLVRVLGAVAFNTSH